MNELEELFELQVSRYPEISDTISDLQILKNVWDFKDRVMHDYDKWKNMQWVIVTADGIELLLDSNKKLQKQIKSFGGKYQIAKQWGVYRDVEGMVRDMSIVLPLVVELHSEAMCERHWRSLASVCHSKHVNPQESVLLPRRSHANALASAR